MPRVVTRRNVFSLCSKLVGHPPVDGWLRVAVAFIKQRAPDVTVGWNDKIDDVPLNTMIKEVLTRVYKEDPAWGRWCVDDQALSVWVDPSSLATGVSLVYDGAVVEDASWLRPEKDSQQINLTELDAIIKGINLAIFWKTTTLHLFLDTLTGKVMVRTKAASEMFIRRRLDTIIKLMKEYVLSMNVSLVKSSQNKADWLTRVPQRWLDAIKRNTGPVQPACTASVSSVGLDQIKIVHRQSGHPGVRRTLYFVKQISPGVSKAAVKTVVRECEECQSIDPVPVHWSKGALNVKQTWHRIAMDITHCNGAHFLTVIDCGPAPFAIWRRLPRQDAISVINQLKALFYERGPPTETLTDNDTAFRSSLLKTFLDEWRVRLRFRCAYVPSGNGIIERCHWTVKGIAARKRCTIPEAVYWYNVTPKDNVSSATAPANMVYRYRIRLKGINGTPAPTHNQQQAVFKPVDRVWVKTPHGRCTTKYKVGRVTSVQNITVDGMPRHVKDLRPIVGPGQPTVCSDMVSETASERFVTIRERPCEQAPSTNAGDASFNNTSNEDQVTILPRRSTLRKRPPPECFMCDHGIRGECSSNATNNLISKKQKKCSLCYRHAETRRRKGRKRCDLFYGGERDKPTWSGKIWWTSKCLSLKWKKSSILLMSDLWTSISSFCKLSELTSA